MTATTDPSVPVATGNEATHLRLVVVGAGLAGIAAAVKLE
jgi:cation diffusion facilitator CzcD-associated flavoprotein CzcO